MIVDSTDNGGDSKPLEFHETVNGVVGNGRLPAVCAAIDNAGAWANNPSAGRMERAMKRIVFWGLCAAIVLLAACRHTTSDLVSGLVSGTGTMLVTGDCHAWHVKSDSGDYYELHNLSEEFRRGGLRVRFTLKERRDLASTCMVGAIADVVSMTKL